MITTSKGKVCCIIFCCTMNSIFAILIQDFKGSSAYLEGDILGADVQQGEQERETGGGEHEYIENSSINPKSRKQL